MKHYKSLSFRFLVQNRKLQQNWSTHNVTSGITGRAPETRPFSAYQSCLISSLLSKGVSSSSSRLLYTLHKAYPMWHMWLSIHKLLGWASYV